MSIWSCKHKRLIETELSFVCGIRINNKDVAGENIRPVYICRDCRVLVSPLEKEIVKIGK